MDRLRMAKPPQAAEGCAVKVSIDTDRLSLPGPVAAGRSAQPQREDLRTAALDELAALGLTPGELEALEETINQMRAASDIYAAWPTAVEDHAVVHAVATLAEGLATVVLGASPRARVALDTCALVGLRDANHLERAVQDLLALAGTIRARHAEKPAQVRRRPPTHLVRALAAIAGHRLGPVTHAENSPFRLAAEAAFALAGLFGSPERAIREYRRELDARV
jgi:hypothetical protein